jgi:hypothetical protein
LETTCSIFMQTLGNGTKSADLYPKTISSSG